MQHENRIELKACPFCDKRKPADWYGPEFEYVERNEKTGKVERTVRYRKYVGCWRCRELRGLCALRKPPVKERK